MSPRTVETPASSEHLRRIVLPLSKLGPLSTCHLCWTGGNDYYTSISLVRHQNPMSGSQFVQHRLARAEVHAVPSCGASASIRLARVGPPCLG